MSTERGNKKKSRPQKYQNLSTFKNCLHDTSKKTKEINTLDVMGCCDRCKQIIEWKIKYKKYKPLTQPASCTKCKQKTVKRAYFTICQPCITATKVCGKCGQNTETALESALTIAEKAAQQTQLERKLRQLSERKRRTILRRQAAGNTDATLVQAEVETEEDSDSDLGGSDLGWSDIDSQDEEP